jgi:hypothetical protein
MGGCTSYRFRRDPAGAGIGATGRWAVGSRAAPVRPIVFAVALLLAGCASCDGGNGERCTEESCAVTCAEYGRPPGGCVSGVCTCAGGADGDADADGETDAEDRDVRDVVEDMPADDAEAGPCDGYRVPVEERPGAADGVTCRRISIDARNMEYALFDFAGQGKFVAFQGGYRPMPMWVFDRETSCLSVFDDASTPVLDGSAAGKPSIEGSRIAYVFFGIDRERNQDIHEIRLGSLDDGSHVTLTRTVAARRGDASEASMDFPTLRYPWVTWRDIREETFYNWFPFAHNIETGEDRNLALDPDSGAQLPVGAVMVDSDGRVVVAGGEYIAPDSRRWFNIYSINLDTREHGLLAPVAASQFWPAITPDWIVWLDQRSHPECDYGSPCYTDIYGLHRPTGEVRALVVAGDSMQGPQLDATGDWMAYEDQRDGTDVVESYDRRQNVYAYHFPTGTEIRVTDWAGFQMNPQVMDRLDGTYSVLLVEEIDYGWALYRLWDCTLPAIE